MNRLRSSSEKPRNASCSIAANSSLILPVRDFPSSVAEIRTDLLSSEGPDLVMRPECSMRLRTEVSDGGSIWQAFAISPGLAPSFSSRYSRTLGYPGESPVSRSLLMMAFCTLAWEIMSRK